MLSLNLRAAVIALLSAIALSAGPVMRQAPATCPGPTTPGIACATLFDPVSCCLPGASTPCTASNGCFCGVLDGTETDGLSCGGGDSGGKLPAGCSGPLPAECAFTSCVVGSCCGRLASGEVGCIPLEPFSTPPPTPCICTLEFAPVCCKDAGGETGTAPNACSCRCDGEVISDGECPSVTEAPPVKPAPCVCTKEYDPVCCRKTEKPFKGEIVQAPNKCTCSCDGEVVSDDLCFSGKPTAKPVAVPVDEGCED